MKYRGKFQFRGQKAGYFYSEWFDTAEEAEAFGQAVRVSGGRPIHMEDEDGNVL